MIGKVTWVIEKDDGDPGVESLIKACKESDTPYLPLDYYPFLNGDQIINWVPTPAVFYGSLQLANAVKKIRPDMVYCNLKNYECTTYYPKYAGHLLNDSYFILPFCELRRKQEFIYDCLGKDNTVFIRPSSGFKLFSGKTVYRPDFERDICSFELYDTPPDSLVVVAAPKNIKKEWRFFFQEKRILCSSQYKENGFPKMKRETPMDVARFAVEMANIWQPEELWCMDICLTAQDELKIVELNSFSCSGIYACDCDILVYQVNEYLMKRSGWND